MASLNRFRNTQTPSKVVHLRNLPWECTEEELIELCKPFGDVVNTKSNVGANHNQAFVEFVDMNQAMQMISYYASSSEPAKVRGRSVYLQYSNRQEIVNSKNSGDGSGNVLLVTIEGAQAGDVSIDVLHLVFSAFGFVHKITTFEKAAGFQALVQFSDGDTAASAKQALDGRSIPRYLLPEHVGSYHLHISFSAYTDLNVKFQSHRSRDYTNPYLPVAPAALDANAQFTIGPDGKRVEPSSNVLLASLENMQYSVTIDVIHTVFSAFGTVQKIAMFEKNGTLQALVQYPDLATAVTAKEALEGHCIYEGGFCKLHLSFSHHSDLNVKINSDWSRDYTVPNPTPGAVEDQRPPPATNPSQPASGAWPSNRGGGGPPSTFAGGQQYFGGSSAQPHDSSNIASAAAQPQYPSMDYSRQMPPPPSQGFSNGPPTPEPWGQMATPTPPPPSMYGGGGSFIPPAGAGPSRGMVPNFQNRS